MAEAATAEVAAVDASVAGAAATKSAEATAVESSAISAAETATGDLEVIWFLVLLRPVSLWRYALYHRFSYELSVLHILCCSITQ